MTFLENVIDMLMAHSGLTLGPDSMTDLWYRHRVNIKIVTDLLFYLTTIMIENIIIVQHFFYLSLLPPAAVGKKEKKWWQLIGAAGERLKKNGWQLQAAAVGKQMAEKKEGKNKGRRESNLDLQNKTRTSYHYTAPSFVMIPGSTFYIQNYLVF